MPAFNSSSSHPESYVFLFASSANLTCVYRVQA
jgi:hypothetical protein